MKHFLVTRFNLRKSDWHTAKDGKEVLDESWLNHRFDLFEKYCLPSVANQKNKNFTWLLFFDTNTSAEARARIENILSSYSHFQPQFIDGFDALIPSLKSILEKEKDVHDYVITSRLDNDDVLNTEYIHTVQKLFLPKNNVIIDLRRGIQLSQSLGKTELRDYFKPYNPFLSLIESTSNVKTVFSRDHHLWGEGASDTIIYDKSSMWIEVVHEKNKLNAVKNYLRKVSKASASDYGLAGDLKTPFLDVLKHNSILKIKDILRPIFKRN